MIEIKNLTKKFNKFTALNQVNIRFNDGHSVALIGPNGCGKTTLIKCILGLNVVEDGDILVNNESVKEHYLYRKNIGYMPQIGRYPENMTIAQTIQMIKDTRKVSESELDTELLEAFELENIFDKKMRTLSGGTTQKVSAVLAFLFNPGIIILDEPTNSMDRQTEKAFINRLQNIVSDKTLIVVTHKTSLLQLVDRVIIIENGSIIVDGPKDEVFTVKVD